jgi:O-antigen/teichoic acid export membrane protein
LRGLSVVGVGLASMAALMAAAVIACSSLAMRTSDGLAVTSYMMLSAAICLSALSFVQNDMKRAVTAER